MYKALDKIREEQKATVLGCRRMADEVVRTSSSIARLLRYVRTQRSRRARH